MKRLAQGVVLMLFLSVCVACQDDAVQPMAKVEAKVGESFTITGPSQLSFASLEGITLTMEVGEFTDHLMKGVVSPRTYVPVSIIGSTTTTYQIETGYSEEDVCYGEGELLCNELSFEANGQPLLLKFEQVYWGEQKRSGNGDEFIAVDSAQLIVVRR